MLYVYLTWNEIKLIPHKSSLGFSRSILSDLCEKGFYLVVFYLS